MTDFWEQKVRTHFRKKDLNKDGVITRDEFLGLGKRFAEQEKFDPQQTKKLMKCFDAVSRPTFTVLCNPSNLLCIEKLCSLSYSVFELKFAIFFIIIIL